MRSILFVVLITLVFVSSPAAAQQRNITEKDLFGFNWIADPQISPDGSRVAFVRVKVNDKKAGYNTSIWIVSPATGETLQQPAARVIRSEPIEGSVRVKGERVKGKLTRSYNLYVRRYKSTAEARPAGRLLSERGG